MTYTLNIPFVCAPAATNDAAKLLPNLCQPLNEGRGWGCPT